MSRLTYEYRVDAVQHLLRHIVEDYYTGCKAYHILRRGKHPDRAHWHVRLKTLAQIGTGLADALNCLRPNWELFYHLAGRNPESTFNPFQAGGGCRGCINDPGGTP